MYLEHWQPGTPTDLFKEALEIDEDYAPALLGLALVAADGFEGKAAEYAREGAEERSEAVRSAGTAGARRARRQQSRESREPKPTKPWIFRPRLWTPWRFWPPSTGLNDKTDHAVDRQDSQDQSALRRSLRHRRALLRHQPPLRRRHQVLPQGARARSRICGRARSELGINLMRLGQEAEARQQLERMLEQRLSEPGDEELADAAGQLQEFRRRSRRPTTILRLHKKEAALLRPYFQSELDRAIATYEKKYQLQAQQVRCRWKSIPIMKTSPCAPWACPDWARWA